ncbi:DUF3775 domain-containing protein [Roseomonas xinghualingensis]|uniref:DUF3775 domain-containing protein n=1 Tax=Roseomonas xinghualingensis TaxID=2986475 RepID=UPI0021F22333|nr:DUF3775 domain-containing protein [Roseomonas sp. SXEYE001]MCV4207808.1 DUF3775 domain-containing protein [Roseomonas sp. SXEYE001]
MSDKPRENPGTPPQDDDGEIDLGISLKAIANIVDAARGSDEDEEDGEELDLEEDEAGEPELDGETLETLIEELNADEQAALIALAWTGRGDFEPDEWEEALNQARERSDGDAADYLTSLDLLGDLLAEGLAAFGIVVEEIER